MLELATQNNETPLYAEDWGLMHLYSFFCLDLSLYTFLDINDYFLQDYYLWLHC